VRMKSFDRDRFDTTSDAHLVSALRPRACALEIFSSDLIRSEFSPRARLDPRPLQ
jgi:hypothetical protein